MGVFSAKTAKISADGTNAVSTVRNIKVNYVAANQRGHGSNTNQGQQFAVAGVKDWTGTFEFYGKTFPLVVGASMTFVAHNGTERATGTALVESVEMTCDIETPGAMLSGVVTFGGNSALTFSTTTTALTDTSDPPENYPGSVCKAAWGTFVASPSYTDLNDVRKWTLKYGCQLQPYSSSSTSGITKRVVGPFTGAEVTIDVYNSTPSELVTAGITPGGWGAAKLYVSATEFWELKYLVTDSVDHESDIEEGKPNPCSLKFSYSSHGRIAGTNTLGAIVNPAGATVWP